MNKKFLKNSLPLILAAIMVIVAGTIFFAGRSSRTGKDSGGDLIREQMAEKAINYVNDFVLQGSENPATLIESSEEAGLIKIKMEIEGNQYDSYITKDGKLFFPQAFEIEESISSSQTTSPSSDVSSGTPPAASQDISYSEGEIEKFVNCLAENNFVIYGADWCGYCQQLVSQFGDYDIVAPIYVECTEKEELCKEKGVTGYPTILLNGERFPGGRNFSDFAQYTGCEAPKTN